MKIVLIGMPFSGKSTVGKLLAEKLGYAFFDTDAVVESIAGQACREIIKSRGEAFFRALEKQAAQMLAKEENAVIATGGGFPLQQEAVALLDNAVYIWLTRTPDFTCLHGRPLCRTQEEFEALWRLRAPVYKRLAHIRQENSTPPAETVLSLVNKLEKL